MQFHSILPQSNLADNLAQKTSDNNNNKKSYFSLFRLLSA